MFLYKLIMFLYQLIMFLYQLIMFLYQLIMFLDQLIILLYGLIVTNRLMETKWFVNIVPLQIYNVFYWLMVINWFAFTPFLTNLPLL